MVRGLLVDLDGTLYQNGHPIEGAAEALAGLDARGTLLRFVTNTTSRPRSAVWASLGEMGLRVDPDHIFTAPLAAREYLVERGLTRCYLLVTPALLEDFAGVEADETAPNAVVLGDMGEEFTFERLNRAFRFLIEGVPLVTMARNRYFLAPDGLRLDVGAFVAGLEYAAGCGATLVGKPAVEFFRRALDSLGVEPSEAAMVGDDLEGDVGGAQAAGMLGVLVRTGKFRREWLERSAVRPDAVLDSLAQVGAWLDCVERA